MAQLVEARQSERDNAKRISEDRRMQEQEERNVRAAKDAAEKVKAQGPSIKVLPSTSTSTHGKQNDSKDQLGEMQEDVDMRGENDDEEDDDEDDLWGEKSPVGQAEQDEDRGEADSEDDAEGEVDDMQVRSRCRGTGSSWS